MRLKPAILLLATSALLNACAATMPRNSTPEDFARQTAVKEDRFAAGAIIYGPQIYQSNQDYGSLVSWHLRLMSTGLKSDRTLAIAVDASYRAERWRFFENAIGVGGAQAPFATLDRKVEQCSSSGCSYREQMLVTFTPEQLQQAAADGLDYKLLAKDGTSIVISVPAAYAAGFYSVLAEQDGVGPSE